jgi:hypothetical protein
LLNREAERRHYLLESCSSGETGSSLRLIKQCSCYYLKRGVVPLRAVKVLSQQSHHEAPRFGCALQPNLRTAAHCCRYTNFSSLSKPSIQSTPLRPFAPQTMNVGGLDIASSCQHTSCPVLLINREVVGGLVPRDVQRKVLACTLGPAATSHCIAESI